MWKPIWTTLILVIGLLGLCTWFVYSHEPRMGGGLSFIYQVRIDPKDPYPQQTLHQVISVIKGRIDPEGTLDVSIQPQGRDRFEIVVPRQAFDDPEDLMRLVRGAGVLEFHITVRANDPEGVNPQDMRAQLRVRGPNETDSLAAAWFAINDLKQWYQTPDDLARLQGDPEGYFGSRDLVAGERDGQYYLLLYTTDAMSLTHQPGAQWTVVCTYPTVDNYGREAVAFELDAPGGRLMNRLTAPNVDESMAIVLDGQVYSAPRIIDAIGAIAQITGTFSRAELAYLRRVLAAGSLPVEILPEPVSITNLGAAEQPRPQRREGT